MTELLDWLQFVLSPQVINGLSIGVAVILMALGLTIIFGLLDVINMAHGEFYALGAYVAVANHSSHLDAPLEHFRFCFECPLLFNSNAKRHRKGQDGRHCTDDRHPDHHDTRGNKATDRGYRNVVAITHSCHGAE